jgi:GDP/UDP-N,N'-diacetylbacillosamine 2-epimerase (hydrolysing)
MGEEPDRIFVIGEPSLDLFKKIPEISKHDISLKLNFNVENDDYFVLIQHSITSEAENQRELIRITLDAIVKSGVKCFINYPNSDAGNHEIIEAYKKYEAKYPEKFKLFRNLDRFTYVNLLRNSKCLLGNSSSGLSEAPTLSLPAINIGKRQRDRICGKNVIFVDNDMDQILMAIKKLEDSDFLLEVSKRENPYGDGNSTEKVIEILANIKIDDKLIYKNITY